MNFGAGVLIAILLLTVPGAVIANAAGLRWAPAIAIGPALTYGVVGLTIVPFGATGIRWNALSALLAFAACAVVSLGFRILTRRHGTPTPVARPRPGWRPDWPECLVAAGVIFGAGAICFAAWRGMSDWQSIPSNWDAVWHANAIRWILDTGQASPTHMGIEPSAVSLTGRCTTIVL